MADVIVFSSPVQADPGATVFRVAQVTFDWAGVAVKVKLLEWDGTFITGGKAIHVNYAGPAAAAFMAALNKADFSELPFTQLLYSRLHQDGKLPGEITISQREERV